jgi:hypothetical protein
LKAVQEFTNRITLCIHEVLYYSQKKGDLREINMNRKNEKIQNMKDDTWKIVTQTHMASYSLINIFRLLWINKFKISFRYIPRFLWVLFISTITLPLRSIEKICFQKKIKNTKLKKDPIFIIGFYRTATTLLHILFSMDIRLGYMSNLDVLTCLYNLSFSKIARRFLEKRLPRKRPMDDIDLLVDGPQEEAYAVATISKYGAPNAIIFPQNFEYFAKYLTFKDCPETDRNKWKKIYHYFVQKTTFKHKGKQLVMKDPANATRIKFLLEMYPNAKFIYTYRNPYPLLCSLKLLFRKLMELSALQTWDRDKFETQLIGKVEDYYSAFKKTQNLIPPENFYTLKYEEFTANPLPFLKEIYEKFDLGDFEVVKPIFQEYLIEKKNYKTNEHEITPEIIYTVNNLMNSYRIDHGYDRLEA